MRKTLLSVLAVMAISASAQAQEIEFGVKAGVNFAKYGGDDADDMESITGFHIGALAEFGITESFAIQPELVYSQQGTNRTYPLFDAETEQNLSYLNIPIALKYYVIDGLSIEAGPQVGFLLSAKGETFSETGEIIEEDDNKDAFKSVDFAVFGGVGYELDMGLFFQARYAAGLSNVLEDSDGDDNGTDDDFNFTNNVFSLSVGYKF